MRTIKFRAKGEKNDKWYYGYFVKDSESSDILNIEDNQFYYVDESTLGQYTGLKDKNGVEIYEGDIVEIDKEVADMFELYSIGVVEYRHGSYKMKNKYKNNALSNLEAIVDIKYVLRGKVIGNIYENKELLEGE